MRSIGFRAENDAINWAVVEGTAEAPVLVASDRLRAPKTYGDAQALAWFRTELIALVAQHSPVAAGIRYAEPMAARGGQKGHPRLRLEGVIQESIYSSGVKEIHAGPLKTISSLLGSDSAKGYLAGADFRGLEWTDLGVNVREAVLAAAAVLS